MSMHENHNNIDRDYMYTATYFETDRTVSYMVGETRDFDYMWEILGGRTVKLNGKQLYRLNNKEMKAIGQWAAYIIEGLKLMLD